MEDKLNFGDLSPSDIAELISGFNERPYRANQLTNWVYKKNASSFDEMSDLSLSFREKLKQNLTLNFPVSLVENKTSKDGTKKYLFILHDGEKIESVLIPEKGRKTLCVSSQVGCAIGCTFCLTGRVGKRRNLSPSEIVGQFLKVRDMEEKVTNIVFMGMGEPLDNINNLIKSLEILIDQNFIGFSKRRITVSTSGLVPQIKELGKSISVNLSISLNAPSDRLRNEIMPINKRYPIEELLKATKEYPQPRRKFITFEYVLLKGINDSNQDAVSLGELLRGMKCKVNLIPFNEANPLPYKTPDRETVLNFQEILSGFGINVKIRKNRGRDILGACGQLAANYPLDKNNRETKPISQVR